MACGFTLNVSRYLNHAPVSGIVQIARQCPSFPISGNGLNNDFILCYINYIMYVYIMINFCNDVNNNMTKFVQLHDYCIAQNFDGGKV